MSVIHDALLLTVTDFGFKQFDNQFQHEITLMVNTVSPAGSSPIKYINNMEIQEFSGVFAPVSGVHHSHRHTTNYYPGLQVACGPSVRPSVCLSVARTMASTPLTVHS